MYARGPERMFQGLNLTADQQTQVKTLLQNQRSQMQAVRNNTTLTQEQKKQQIGELRKTNHQQMMAVLTPEQQAQLQQMRAKHEKRGFQGRGLQALNLTDQQKEQIKPIFDNTRQQVQALRGDTSLTPEQRRQKLQEIRSNQQTQLNAILTPEQQQQLQQRRGRHAHGAKSPPPQGV